MCKAMEDMRNEAKIENAIEVAKNLIRRGKYTLEEIAEDTKLSLEQVKELAGA